jgi:hypothetical protein
MTILGLPEWTKVKYTQSENTLRHPFEHQLKYYNENKDCKIDTVWGCTHGRGDSEGRRLGLWYRYIVNGLHTPI